VEVTQVAAQATKTGDAQYLTATTNLQTTGSAVVIINGYNIGTFTQDNTVGDVIEAVNAKSADTGVTAALSAGSSGYLVLTQTHFGDDYSILYSDTGKVFATAACTFTQAGTDAQGTITFTGGSTLTLNSGAGLTLAATGGTFKVGLTALATLAVYANAVQVTMGSATFQIGANAGQTATATIDDIAAIQLGTTVNPNGVAGIDVTSDAQTAIQVLDEAISQISTVRARLGSTQKNILETNINSLTVAKQNVAASESSIRDTDMAYEVVEFTRSQILVQASVAMIAQANSAPQTLLSLLR
jgi:flagellin